MPGEKNIGTATGERLHCQARPPDQLTLIMPFRYIEGMVRDDDFDDLITKGAQPLADACDLIFADASIFDGERAGSVKPENEHLFVSIKWFKIAGNVAPVFIQRLKETGKDIVKRNVVITGHHNLWRWQGI